MKQPAPKSPDTRLACELFLSQLRGGLAYRGFKHHSAGRRVGGWAWAVVSAGEYGAMWTNWKIGMKL